METNNRKVENHTFDFIKKLQKCANEDCHNEVTPENIHILLVSVAGNPLAKVYEYCSKKCMEKKLTFALFGTKS